MNDRLPIAGTRIFDLTREAAGGACARIFAELGADVIKAAPEAIAHLGCETCDLVLSDLRCRELDEIGWTSTDAGGPSVVSITPFGLDGPSADSDDARSACGWLGQRAGAALTTAHAAVVGLAALRSAHRFGQRLTAEVATYEVAATCLGAALPPAVCSRPQQPAPDGSRITVAPCADGFVGISAPTLLDRAHLAALTGVPAVATESADPAALLADWLSARTRMQVFHEAQLWRIPIVPVLTQGEALDDARFAEDGVWRGWSTPSPSRVTGEETGEFPPLLRGRVGERRRNLPLHDIRVLDLGMVWAGPYCGRLLAALGANVIKVEGPARRDGTRPPDEWEGCAGVYADLNRGKSSLVVDLAGDAGRNAFLRIARDVDVVIDSFSPRVMPNLGLHHGALAGANPEIITLAMPAFRPDGPWGSYVAYGSGLELVAGLARRSSDGRPQPAPVPYLDYLSGACGAIAVLAALIARDRRSTDSGNMHIELAQHDVARRLTAEELHCPPDGERPFDPAALALDPRLIARGLFSPTGSSDCKHALRPPWLVHGLSPALERDVPPFGSDSLAVLVRAGLTRRAITDLIRTGVVVARDPAGNRSRL